MPKKIKYSLLDNTENNIPIRTNKIVENMLSDTPSNTPSYAPSDIKCPPNSIYDTVNNAPSKEKICHCINPKSSGDINSPDYYKKKWVQVDGAC